MELPDRDRHLVSRRIDCGRDVHRADSARPPAVGRLQPDPAVAAAALGKLFTFHNWLGYIGLATAFTHPLILLLSATAGFRLFDIVVPIWSPTQPIPNTLGAIALLPGRVRRPDVVLPPGLRPPSLEAAALHGVRRGGRCSTSTASGLIRC